MRMRYPAIPLGLLVMFLGIGPARAADHADGTPASLDQPDASSDLADVFAWMSADAGKVNLAMTVFPGAVAGSKFSDAVKYVFHLNSKKTGILDAASPLQLVCSFDVAQKISCWLVDKTSGTTVDYVTGDASAAAGVSSASGKLKVFAGLRNDPFFFNLAGFKNASKTVAEAVAAYTTGNLTYIKSIDAHGCPKLADGIGNALLGLLSHDCSANALASPAVTGDAAVDAFSKPGAKAAGAGGCVNQALSGNIMAIVVSVDKSLVTTSGGPFLGVWGSTNK